MLWPLQAIAETGAQEPPAGRGRQSLSGRPSGRCREQIEQALDRYRELRDRHAGAVFKTIYNSPLVEALAGLRAPHADARKPRARDEHAEQLLEAKIEAIKTREEQGGFAEAVLRIMLAVAAGRAHARCARLPPRPADQAGASAAQRRVRASR